MARERQRARSLAAQDAAGIADGADIADKWIFGALVGLLFWVPLPLGSNRTWALGVLVAWAFVLLAGVAYVWRRHSDAAWQRLAQFGVPPTRRQKRSWPENTRFEVVVISDLFPLLIV